MMFFAPPEARAPVQAGESASAAVRARSGRGRGLRGSRGRDRLPLGDLREPGILPDRIEVAVARHVREVAEAGLHRGLKLVEGEGRVRERRAAGGVVERLLVEGVDAY